MFLEIEPDRLEADREPQGVGGGVRPDQRPLRVGQRPAQHPGPERGERVGVDGVDAEGGDAERHPSIVAGAGPVALLRYRR